MSLEFWLLYLPITLGTLGYLISSTLSFPICKRRVRIIKWLPLVVFHPHHPSTTFFSFVNIHTNNCMKPHIKIRHKYISSKWWSKDKLTIEEYDEKYVSYLEIVLKQKLMTPTKVIFIRLRCEIYWYTSLQRNLADWWKANALEINYYNDPAPSSHKTFYK